MKKKFESQSDGLGHIVFTPGEQSDSLICKTYSSTYAEDIAKALNLYDSIEKVLIHWEEVTVISGSFDFEKLKEIVPELHAMFFYSMIPCNETHEILTRITE